MLIRSHQSRLLKLKLCVSAFLWISPLIALTACSHEDSKQYAPLTYDYLTPIFFNVSQMTVQNQTNLTTYPDDISNLSPTSPALALSNMANNRLKARGVSGNGVFIIKRASLQKKDDDTIYGQIDVALEIYNNNQKKVAMIQVSTNHTYETDRHKGDVDSRANLYDVTQKMMQDINVELEYQIRNHLEPWLVDATGTPISDAIKTQNLDTTPPAPRNDTSSPSAATKHNALPKNEDLNAIFPTGLPDNDQTHSAAKENKNNTSSSSVNHPVGVLGTLPQSAVSKKY